MSLVHCAFMLPGDVCVSDEENKERWQQGVQLPHGTGAAETGQEGRSAACGRNYSGHFKEIAKLSFGRDYYRQHERQSK